LQPTPPAHALLTAGDPIKNASAILRYALPIDNKPIRKVQVRQQQQQQQVQQQQQY
jgi:peptidylprolyl isomerase